jgi:hypothetical protein
MEHDEAVRLQMTEQYLLDELSPEARESFEEHYFDCHECAVDVGAGATFVEQSKIVLAEKAELVPGPVKLPQPAPAPSPWRAWFRPALVLPVLTMLLAVVTYQNFVSVPKLLEAVNHPRELSWTTVNIDTLGSDGGAIPVRSGEGFVLLLRIPQGDYTSYTADLYDPQQKLEWTVTLPATVARDASPRDHRAVQIPWAKRQSGTYSVVVRGATPGGGSEEVGRGSFELQVQ